MDKITKLRTLIWDKEKKVFSDLELEEFLSDAGGNVWRTAALCLKVVLANPEREERYSRGRVSVTRNKMEHAIEFYEDMAGDYGVQTANVSKTYPGGMRNVGGSIYPGY